MADSYEDLLRRGLKNDDRFAEFLEKLKNSTDGNKDEVKKFREFLSKHFYDNPNRRPFSSSRVYGEDPIETRWKDYSARKKGSLGEYRRTEEIIKSLEKKMSDLTERLENPEPGDNIEELRRELEETREEYAEQRQDLKDSGGKKGAIVKHLEQIERSLKEFWGVIKQFNDPWAKIDHAASQYSKAVGQTSTQYKGMRKDAINAVQREKLGIKYNTSAEEVIKFQQNYAIGAGRNIKASRDDMETIAAMSAVYGDKASELSVLFEKFGVSIEGTGEHLGKMFNEASKSGISLERYAGNVQKGLALAQTYTFAGGLRSMEAMAKRAAKIHMDFQQIQVLADKTSNVEGAITTAAKMQVLGGPFAAFADPLGMLSESWGDMEGLAKRMEKVLAGMGRFDKRTGEVHVDAFNRQRLRAYADATGQSFDQVMEQTHQQAKLGEIRAQIARSSAAGLSPEMRELIENTATFKDGKAGVNITGRGFVALNDLKDEDKKALEIEAQGEAKDIKQIAVDLRSLVDSRQGFEKQVENAKAWISQHLGIGGLEKILTNFVGKLTPLLTAVVGIGLIAKLAGAGGGVFKSFRGLSKKPLKLITPEGPSSQVQQVGQTISSTPKGGAGAKGTTTSTESAGSQAGKTKTVNAKGQKSKTKEAPKTETPKDVQNKVKGKNKKINKGKTTTNKVSEIKEVSKPKKAPKPSEISKAEKLGKKQLQSLEKTKSFGKNLSRSGGLKGKTGNLITKYAGKQETKLVGKEVNKRISGKMAKTAGKKLATRAIKGGGVGVVGAIGNIGTDIALEKGVVKKGGAMHGTLRIGSTAAEGAGIGMMLAPLLGPLAPIAPAMGAAAGAIVGAVKFAKETRTAALDKKLENIGIERKGNYGAHKLKKIDQALTSGKKISNRLRRKMEREGDFEMLKAIEQKQTEKKEEKIKKKAERRERIKGFAKSAVKGAATLISAARGGKDNISKLKTATFYVDKADFFNKNVAKANTKKGKIAETINKVKKAPINSIKGTLVSTLPGGQPINLIGNALKSGVKIISGHKEKLNPEKIRIPRITNVLGNSLSNNKIEPVDVNINGTIKLQAPNGQNIDIINLLKNDQHLLNEIAQIIANQTNALMSGGASPKRVRQFGANPI